MAFDDPTSKADLDEAMSLVDFELFYNNDRGQWGMRCIPMGRMLFGTFEQAVNFAHGNDFKVSPAVGFAPPPID